MDGTIPDPSHRYICHFITPIIAGIGEFLGADLLGAGLLAGGADALGPASAAITLPDVLATAPAIAGGTGAAADAAFGAGALAAGATGLELAGAGAAPAIAGGVAPAAAPSALGDALGAGPPDTLIPSDSGFAGPSPIPAVAAAPQPPPLTFASQTTGVGGAATPSPITATVPTGAPLSPSMAPVSAGPTGVAPAAPASIGSVSPAQSGDFSSVLGDFSPRPDAATGDVGGDFGGNPEAVSAAAGGAKPEGFLSRVLGSGTVSDIKDAGSVLGPIAAIGGLGNAILNSNNKVPGRSQLVGLPNLAGQTVQSTAANANQAATSASDKAAAAASDAITRATQASTTVSAAAEGEIASGRQMMNYISTGELPPGVANAIRSATEASKATIRSQHAARGTSGSSAEAQELSAASERAEAAGTQVAMQLLQQGSSMVTGGISAEGQAGQLALSGGSLGSSTALGGGSLEANTELGAGGMALNAEQLAQSIYTTIMNESLQKDQQLGSAIGNFAAALAGGPSSITLKAA